MSYSGFTPQDGTILRNAVAERFVQPAKWGYIEPWFVTPSIYRTLVICAWAFAIVVCFHIFER
jgi:hypothetical protein